MKTLDSVLAELEEERERSAMLTEALARALAAVPAPFAVYGGNSSVGTYTRVSVGPQRVVGWCCPLCGAEAVEREALVHDAACPCAALVAVAAEEGRA